MKLLRLGVIALAAAAATARAQTPPAEAGSDSVIVSGEKVRRDRQQTFTSVGVITGSQIEEQGLLDMRSTFRLIANVNSSPANNGNNGISIRGINSEGIGAPGGNLRPLASMIIDGATQSAEGLRRGARGLWDMEQVEVFRGPQSTLQGRNALAGAVVMRSRDPAFNWEGAARAIAGTDAQRDGAFMLSGPIADKQLAFRLSGEYQSEQHGISYTDPRLQGLDDGVYHALRGKLLARPAALPGLEVKLTVLDSHDAPAVTAVSGPNYFKRVLERAAAGIETRENDVRNIVLDANYTIAPGWQLTSVTSWIDTDVRFDTPTPDYVRDETRYDRDVTQDLRLAYDGGRVSGVMGLFLGRFDNERDSLVQAVLVPGQPAATIQDLRSSNRIDNVGVYGEGRYRFDAATTLIAGLRYDRERSSESFTDRRTGSAKTSSSASYSAWLPKLGLAYAWTPQQTTALTYSEGYRAGFSENNRTVAPETLQSLEFAWRAQWPQALVTTNLNVFGYRWRDQQISLRDSGNPLEIVTVNAGRSRAWGAEFEADIAPLPALRLGARIGVLRTRLENFAFEGADFSGNQFPEAPQFTGALLGTWRFADGWIVAADYGYKSSYYATSDIANRPTLRVPWSGTANLRVGYQAEQWDLVLAADNLFNADYLTGRDILTGAYVGDQRRVSATLGLRF